MSYKIAYTDWVAGVCTVEWALWGSFIIGAVASLAAASNDVYVTPPPDPIPSTSIDQGVLHNAVVSNYFAQGYTGMNYADVINVACQVRPDLTTQIQALDEQQVMTAVNQILGIDISTPEAQINFINGVMNFSANDLTTMTNAFNNLETLYSASPAYPLIWEVTVNNLISQVPSFNLSQANMSALISSLQILRSSYVLWGGSQW